MHYKCFIGLSVGEVQTSPLKGNRVKIPYSAAAVTPIIMGMSVATGIQVCLFLGRRILKEKSEDLPESCPLLQPAD